MRNIIIAIAALLPFAMNATEAADTTVNYQGRKFVICTNDTETKITVYQNDTTKIKESVYVDGNNIVRTYVSSPFSGDDELQTMGVKGMLPTLWAGINRLTDGIGKGSEPTGNNMWGSFEAGITPLRTALSLDRAKTVGLISGVQLVFYRHRFEHDFGMRMNNGLVERIGCDATTANNMFFGSVRVPLLFTLQEPQMPGAVSLGVSFEARTNAKYNFKAADNTAGMSDGLKLNRFGVNLEMYLNYGPVYLGLKAGLTPIFKTTDGVKANMTSISIGADLDKIFKLSKKK